MVHRRDFLEIVGAGGLGSLLAPAVFGAEAERKLTATATATAAQPFSQIKLVMDLGINLANIPLVRQAIEATIPDAERQVMSDHLVEARQAYASGVLGVPTAAAALEAQFNPWAPILAARMPRAAVLPETEKVEPDVDPIDGWTLVHFLSGCILGAICLDFQTTLRLLILWEIIEPKIWPGWHESPANQIVDVIAGMLGWYLAKKKKEEILNQLLPKTLPGAALQGL